MLYEKLKEDLKTVTLQKNSVARDCLRMVISEINNQNMLYKKDITDQLCLNIITKSVKTHKDSIAQFETANRQDLADKEKAELDVLETYLPKMKNEEETLSLLRTIVSENNIDLTVRSSIGQIMKQLSQYNDVDKSLASKLIQQL